MFSILLKGRIRGKKASRKMGILWREWAAGLQDPGVVPLHDVCPVRADKARGCLFSVLNCRKFFEAQEARDRRLPCCIGY